MPIHRLVSWETENFGFFVLRFLFQYGLCHVYGLRSRFASSAGKDSSRGLRGVAERLRFFNFASVGYVYDSAGIASPARLGSTRLEVFIHTHK